MSRWFSLLARIVASSQKSNLIIKLVIVEFLLDTIIIYFSILLGVDTKIVSLDIFQITPISSSLKWASFFYFWSLNISFVFCNYAKATKWAMLTFANSLSTLQKKEFISGDLCLFKAFKTLFSTAFHLSWVSIPLLSCSVKPLRREDSCSLCILIILCWLERQHLFTVRISCGSHMQGGAVIKCCS